MTLLTKSRPLVILDFDIENRPLSYWQPDRPTAEITAIASCWIEKDQYGEFRFGSMEAHLLGHPKVGGVDLEFMLHRFSERYNMADMVTGHYIRNHDLPIINGALYELGMPLLGPKMTCDTKLDMFKKADVPATQEFIIETLGVPVPKVHMTQADWREANRLTEAGLEKTRARVTSDVQGHILMRDAMLKHGMLRPPSVWNPGGGVSEESQNTLSAVSL